MGDSDEDTGPVRKGADAQQSKDLDKMNAAPSAEMDASVANAALKKSTGPSKFAQQQSEREQRLAAVKVAQADIDVLVQHLELSSDKAEALLRTHAGDLAATLLAEVLEVEP